MGTRTSRHGFPLPADLTGFVLAGGTERAFRLDRRPPRSLKNVRAAVKALGLGKLCKCGARLGTRKDPKCSACRAIYMKHYRDRGKGLETRRGN